VAPDGSGVCASLSAASTTSARSPASLARENRRRAVKLALAGHEVVGCDADGRVVELVNQARAPFPGEPGLQKALERVVPAGSLRATTDTAAAVAEAPSLVITVPPLVVDSDARPDFRILDAALTDIGRGLKPGTVVCVETTLPVGTTRARVAPLLERHSGLRAEEDFFSVHSPERVYSGRVFSDLDAYPKLVGGLTSQGEQRAVDLYRSFLQAEVWGMGSAEAAELAKLAETTYRDVNIALANEFARFADRVGVDVHKVIDASNSQPFSHIHRLGVAVGGHCIPVYPRFYLAGDPEATLPAAARSVNEGMPAYAVSLLARDVPLNKARVLILGVSYRGAVKESAFSVAFALRDELLRQGATPVALDPMYTSEELEQLAFTPWDGGAVDGAIVQADHPQYSTLTPGDLPGVRALVDGRAIVRRGLGCPQGHPWLGSGSRPATRSPDASAQPRCPAARPRGSDDNG
jgi:UDP-N-acetyl-D-glucosamine dehydrogenase